MEARLAELERRVTWNISLPARFRVADDGDGQEVTVESPTAFEEGSCIRTLRQGDFVDIAEFGESQHCDYPQHKCQTGRLTDGGWIVLRWWNHPSLGILCEPAWEEQAAWVLPECFDSEREEQDEAADRSQGKLSEKRECWKHSANILKELLSQHTPEHVEIIARHRAGALWNAPGAKPVFKDKALVLALVHTAWESHSFSPFIDGRFGRNRGGPSACFRDGLPLFDCIAPHFLADRDVALAAVSAKHGSQTLRLFPSLCGDRAVVLAAFSSPSEHDEESPLRWASPELQGDREVVFKAIEHFPVATGILETDKKKETPLKWASRELQNDRAVVLAAIRAYPLLVASCSPLRYTSDVLKDDEEVVMNAVAKRGGARKDANPRFADFPPEQARAWVARGGPPPASQPASQPAGSKSECAVQ